jgi:Fe-Mn family superoxide dismutase
MTQFHYEAQNFERLYGTPGFSEKLLKNHFTLYEGYVKNTNQLIDEFARLQGEDKLESPEFAELKRRFGWEWNGIRLHEYYFGNLTKDRHPYDKGSELAQKLERDFGSFDKWQKNFQALGSARGIGWVALYHDVLQDRFWNVWINEHDTGHFAGAEPLLLMDVFEHAFMNDYGTKKAGYIEAFFNAICWRTVEERYDIASQRAEKERSLRLVKAA